MSALGAPGPSAPSPSPSPPATPAPPPAPAPPAASGRFDWSDFSNAHGLSLNGDATIDKDALRLTASTAGQVASAFTTFGLDAGRFHTSFSFALSKPKGPGVDCNGKIGGGEGLAFVLHTSSPTSVGMGDGGLGFEGIPNSFAIKFDAFCETDHGDSATNYIGIVANDVELASAPIARDLDDGTRRYVWIDYDGTALEVRVNNRDQRPALPNLTYQVDIPSMTGGTICCAGFTAATGDLNAARQEVFSWTFDEDDPYGISSYRRHSLQPVCRNRTGSSVRR